ncbi:MAG TPA: DUF6468 domain-containing protein [Rhodopila sp.]
MAAMEWTLEIVLVILLGATLLQAIRLERALGVLKRDRASFESLVVGFDASTHQAENGIEQLRAVAEGTGRQIESQLSKSLSLKEDLTFLTERGNRLADRLDTLVRAARPLAPDRDVPVQRRDAPARETQAPVAAARAKQPETAIPSGASQVERDLLQALRMAR